MLQMKGTPLVSACFDSSSSVSLRRSGIGYCMSTAVALCSLLVLSLVAAVDPTDRSLQAVASAFSYLTRDRSPVARTVALPTADTSDLRRDRSIDHGSNNKKTHLVISSSSERKDTTRTPDPAPDTTHPQRRERSTARLTQQAPLKPAK